MISIECHDCGSGYAVKGHYVGKKFRCTQCQTILQVPGSEEDSSSVSPPQFWQMPEAGLLADEEYDEYNPYGVDDDETYDEDDSYDDNRDSSGRRRWLDVFCERRVFIGVPLLSCRC